MPRFEDHLNFLHLFISTTSRQRKALLSSSNISQRLAIIELIYNFLKGSILVEPELKQLFFKDKEILRKLSKKSVKSNLKLFLNNIGLIHKFLEIVIKKLT